MPSSPMLQAWAKMVAPSLNEGRQRYTNCNHIFLRLWCPHGAVDIRVRVSLLLPDELYKFLARFDQHPNRNSSLLEQVQDNCHYRYKSECAGALAGAETLAGRELLRQASGRKCNQKASGESIECHELHS